MAKHRLTIEVQPATYDRLISRYGHRGIGAGIDRLMSEVGSSEIITRANLHAAVKQSLDAIEKERKG